MQRLPPEEYEKKKQQDIKEKLTYYYGPRDASFKKVIKDILTMGNLKPKYLDVLLTDESLDIFGKAFTSNSIHSYLDKTTEKIIEDANSDDNYEVYEKLGDGIFSNFIGWYAFRMLGQDKRVAQVKIYATIKSKYGAREEFAPVAENLGLWPFISASIYKRTHSKKSLLEDVFEALLGATSYILDDKFRYGVGYAICYDILVNIFSTIKLQTEFEELQDYVSKLNEFSLKNKDYKFEYDFNKLDRLTYVTVYRIMPDGSRIKFGEGAAANKPNAKKAAAENTYKQLEKNKLV